LVGRNGSGKSTLFKIILGEEHYDSGDITVPKGYVVGALPQHIHFTEDRLIDECSQVLSEDEQYNIYKIERLLFGLGFTKDDLDREPSSFSGGYQIRINLVKLLATEPNLLLLDEPTNYLDIVSMRWLEGFLRAFDGEVILITHDREFMDSVATHTMGIHRRGLKVIKGGTKKYYTQLVDDEILSRLLRPAFDYRQLRVVEAEGKAGDLPRGSDQPAHRLGRIFGGGADVDIQHVRPRRELAEGDLPDGFPVPGGDGPADRSEHPVDLFADNIHTS
jgi:ATPase subunit of ABC transporter with duplicated ATPase domains